MLFRSVNCDYAVQKLLEKELISISGKSDGPGRPILYSTSDTFMDYFGIKSVNDLPQLKDIRVESNEIGQPAELSDATGNEEQPVVTEQAEEIATEQAQEIVADFVETPEDREILSPDAAEGHIDESEIPMPDRKQIYMENQEGVSDDSTVEEPRMDSDESFS